MKRKNQIGMPEEPEAGAGEAGDLDKERSALPIVYRQEEDAITLDVPSLKKKLKAIHDFQILCREHLHEGIDFGTIPGTQKPTLYKPGAEKITKLLGLADTFETEDQKLDFKTPFFSFDIKCRLVSLKTGVVVSEGVGHANSMESRWRYRWLWENKLSLDQAKDKASLKQKKVQGRDGKWYTQYQVENDDIFSLVNTIKKMAKKRSHVDAALSAGRLSDLFTQDVEDLKDHIEAEVIEEAQPKPAAATPAAKPEPKPEPKAAPAPQAKPPAPAEKKPAAAKPSTKEEVVARIKQKLLDKTIDPKEFKLFLFDFQKTHKVKFVGMNEHGKASLHQGEMEDLERLSYHIEYMTSQYLAWEEAKKPKPGEPERMKAPFDAPEETEREGEDEEDTETEDDEGPGA